MLTYIQCVLSHFHTTVEKLRVLKEITEISASVSREVSRATDIEKYFVKKKLNKLLKLSNRKYLEGDISVLKLDFLTFPLISREENVAAGLSVKLQEQI